MARLKVIEVLAESSKSWEDAVQTAVGRANETVRNVRSTLRTALSRGARHVMRSRAGRQ